MAEERRLFIGSDFGTNAGAVAFLGSHNLHEANIIFWSPPNVSTELAQHGNVVSFYMHTLLQQRMAALAQWVEQGHTLVLIGAHSVAVSFHDQSGNVRQMTLEGLSPLSGVNFVFASGSRIEFCGPPKAEAAFTNLIPRMRYQCLLEGADLTPLLRVAAATTGAVQVVGAFRKLGLGTVFYVPPFATAPIDSKEFFDELAKLPTLLRSSPAELLDWVYAYQSGLEKRTAERIAELENQVAGLQVQVAKERGELAEQGSLKQLLCGTGSAFATAVAAALTELSLTVVEGPHPRADLLSARTTRFIALEAKGLDGPTKEAHFRQVERWVAEVNSTVGLTRGHEADQPPDEVKKDPDLRRYFEQLEKLGLPFTAVTEDCKGVMVIGTFRTTPLADRSEPDFPEPVLRLLNRSSVCALTGLQLFNLVMQVRERPEMRDEIVGEIVHTIGVLERGKDWAQYLGRQSDA